jgi:hypothetical protein
MKPCKSLIISGLACLVGLLASSSRADSIYASADSALGSAPLQNLAITGNQFIGVRFQVTGSVTADMIGLGNASGSGTIFGELVKLNLATDFPNSSQSTVLRTTLLTLPSVPTASDLQGSIAPVILDAGYYALLFGTNANGASGSGTITNIYTPNGNPDFFFASNSGTNYFNGGVAAGQRLFLNGSVTTAPLPSAAGLAMTLLTCTGLLGFWKRRSVIASDPH